jgi:cytochrome b561
MFSYKANANTPAAGGYSRVAIALHWLIALALLADLVLGWWMLELPKAPPGLRAGWFNAHKSIGICIFMAVLVRMMWRAAHPVPEPSSLPAWQRMAAHATHGLLYLCMIAVPLSGYLGSTFTRYPVLFFGMALPQWNRDWPAAKALMSTVHTASSWLLVALVAMHTAASLWHWVRRDGIAARMGLPERPRTAGALR